MAKSSDSQYLGRIVRNAALLSVLWGICAASEVLLVGVVAPGCTRGGGGSSSMRSASLATPASIEKAAFLGGGSGEKLKPNFFVEDLRDLDGRLRARGWRVTLVTPPQSTSEAFLRGVRETLASVRPGGQALIVIHTHGREREIAWGQRSHSVSSEDVDSAGGEVGFDLDTIEPLLVEAKARGVRVALVDLSCYSGATQALKGASCTVTLAASRYVSLCSGREEERLFNSRFLKLPEAGVARSLETQFREARKLDVDSINLPQISSISTPIGVAWESFLSVVDPLDTYEELKGLKGGAKPLDTRAWTAQLDDWLKGRKLLDDPRGRKLRDEIVSALQGAVDRRKSLESQMAALARDHDVATLEVRPAGREAVKLGPAYLAEMLRESEAGAPAPDFSGAQLSLATALQSSRADWLATYAKPLAQYEGRRVRFDDDTEALTELAGRLFELERELYELALEGAEDAAKGAAKTSNPCRDFAF